MEKSVRYGDGWRGDWDTGLVTDAREDGELPEQLVLEALRAQVAAKDEDHVAEVVEVADEPAEDEDHVAEEADEATDRSTRRQRPRPRPSTQRDPEPELAAEAQADPEPEPELAAEAQPDPEPELAAEAQADPEPESEPASEAHPDPDPEPEVEPVTEPAADASVSPIIASEADSQPRNVVVDDEAWVAAMLELAQSNVRRGIELEPPTPRAEPQDTVPADLGPSWTEAPSPPQEAASSPGLGVPWLGSATVPAPPATTGPHERASATSGPALSRPAEPLQMANRPSGRYRSRVLSLAAVVFVIAGLVFIAYAFISSGSDDQTQQPTSANPAHTLTLGLVESDGLSLSTLCAPYGFEGTLVSSLEEPTRFSLFVDFTDDAGALLHQARLSGVTIEAQGVINVDFALSEDVMPEGTFGQPVACAVTMQR